MAVAVRVGVIPMTVVVRLAVLVVMMVLVRPVMWMRVPRPVGVAMPLSAQVLIVGECTAHGSEGYSGGPKGRAQSPVPEAQRPPGEFPGGREHRALTTCREPTLRPRERGADARLEPPGVRRSDQGVDVFSEPLQPPTPPELLEFKRAMSDAVSSGADVWILTKAGERFVGELESVTTSSEDQDLFGLEVTVTIQGRTLIYQEIASWTVGLSGEPDDVLLDASILQTLDLGGPLTAEDLVVELARSPAPVWCTVQRARGRLSVLEAEGRVLHTPEEPPTWRIREPG